MELARQAFSSAFDRMAVNLPAEANGGTHVGWIDASTGAITDVTAQVASQSGSFAAAPRHSSALFDRDGNFGYFDDNARTYVFIDTHFDKVRTQAMPDSSATTSKFLMPNGSVSDDARSLSRGMVLSIAMPGGGTIESSSYSPVVWVVDAKRGLQIKEPVNAPNALQVVTVGQPVPVSITPVSDYTITSAVSDPTSTSVVFVARRGASQDTFRVPLDGSAQPVKLGTLQAVPSTYSLVGWKYL